MEDYIFILIAVLLSVFGAMNRKKAQKKPAGKDEPENGRAASGFEQLFQDPLFREEQPVRPAKRQSSAPAFTPRSPSSRPFQRASSPKSEKKPKMKADMTRLQEKQSPHSLRNDFSLKKAVVYSEIIRRKY
ncbi:MAG: hypothetical protein AB7D05_03340 [Mangrovibacterium sp.]